MPFPEKFLKLILRLNGALAVMAIGAVVMPHSWLVWWVDKAEPGLAVGFLVGYLARTLSMFFVLVGLFLLVFASDVHRYRRPITYTAVWVLGAIACFGLYCWPYLPELLQHRFFWFVVADASWSLLFSVAILVCQSRIKYGESISGPERRGAQTP